MLLTLILVVAAVVPAVYLMVRVYRADRLEKEPVGLLLALLFLGIMSTGAASFTEQVGESFLSSLFPDGGLVYNVLLYFIVVAVSEEGFKYLLLKLRTWKSPHFNCTFDGVVYAVFVSLGFALWENIAYVLSYGLGAALARAVTAVPGHACFGVFMGIWYGAAKKYEICGLPKQSKDARLTALILPALLHGVYDFIATLHSEVMGIVFLVFVAWMFRRALKIVKDAAARDELMRAPYWNSQATIYAQPAEYDPADHQNTPY